MPVRKPLCTWFYAAGFIKKSWLEMTRCKMFFVSLSAVNSIFFSIDISITAWCLFALFQNFLYLFIIDVLTYFTWLCIKSLVMKFIWYLLCVCFFYFPHILSFVYFQDKLLLVLFIGPNIIESWGIWETEPQQKVLHNIYNIIHRLTETYGFGFKS